MPDEEQIQSGFVRRRRYLILLSLALAATKYVGLSFREISVLGNSATVANPENIILLGYVAWIFAVWNYWQWFNDYNAWGKTKAAQKQLMYERIRAKIFPTRVVVPDEIRQALRTDADRNSFGSNFTVVTDSGGILHPDNLNLPTHIRVNAVAQVQTSPFDISRTNARQFDMELPDGMAYQCFMSALFSVVFSRRYFSEYFAPFLIGLMPLVSIVVSKP